MSAPIKNRADERGFSLIEVLVALGVLAVIAGTAWQALSGGLATAIEADRRARAVTIAQTALARVMAADQPATGTTTGIEDGLRWTLTVEPTRELIAQPIPGLVVLAVTATVRWDKARQLTLATLKIGRGS